MTPLRMLLTMWRKKRSSAARAAAARLATAVPATGDADRRRLERASGRCGMWGMSARRSLVVARQLCSRGKGYARAVTAHWREKAPEIRRLRERAWWRV